MDSKSISRKGVGVRLPSLAPSEAGDALRQQALAELARQLGALLWPALERELRNARAELARLVGELRIDRSRFLRDEVRLARQEELGERTHRAGWCLGMLAAARGIDLVYTRREPEGLRWLVGALADARGIALAPGASELPRSDKGGAQARELSLLACWCTLQAGVPGGLVRWTARRRGAGLELVFECQSSSIDWPEDVLRVSSAFSHRLALGTRHIVLNLA